VIHPMGWDAFGLPAENAAMERDVHPADWTISNISSMKKQMERILADFDWDRVYYYKWTQYLFLQMYKARLAYQKEAIVNWDPVDQTVLANEQPLLNDLDLLDKWPDHVKQMQRNWIGKSKGAEFDFIVVCILTKALWAPYVSRRWLPQNTCSQVLQFVEKIRQQQLFDLNDVNIGQGHPITGLSIPIYVASYVVSDYGTGAVMGVPAHDERDWEFVRVNRIISEENLKKVIIPVIRDNCTFVTIRKSLVYPYFFNKVFTSRGILSAECGQYTGLSSDDAEKAIVNDAQKAGYGRWSIQVVPVPESELPILLPANVTFSGRGGSPLKQVQEWINCKYPSKPIQISTGMTPVVSFEKMSKSKYNGVDPETTINNYGADATRLHILFKAPVSEVLEWEDASIVGMQRWIARVWRLVESVVEKEPSTNNQSLNFNVNLLSKEDRETYRIINITIKEVTEDYKNSTFNTAVSSLIKLTNHLTSISTYQNENASKKSTIVSPTYEYGIKTLVKMMAPMAPSIGEEFWEILNQGKQYSTSIFEELWPKVDTECLNASEVTCVVQINGKMRFSLMIPSTVIQDNLSTEKLILESENGKKWLGKVNADKKIKKIIHANEGKI
ncbi:16122_t:CDS:10, partial [Racocetra fulgida]